MADLKLDEAKLLKMVDDAEARAKGNLAFEADEMRRQVKEAAAALRDLPTLNEIFAGALGLGTITVPKSSFPSDYPVAVNVQIDNQMQTAVSFVRPRDQEVRVLVVVLPIEKKETKGKTACFRSKEFFGAGDLTNLRCAACAELASVHVSERTS